MALLDHPKLDPQNVHYNDVIALPIASGYDFVSPTATHEVRIARINPAHAVNPGHFVMTEGPAGEWTVAVWDLALQIDGNPDLINFDVSNDILYINPTTFPVEDEFYIVGVVEHIQLVYLCRVNLLGTKRHGLGLQALDVGR